MINPLVRDKRLPTSFIWPGGNAFSASCDEVDDAQRMKLDRAKTFTTEERTSGDRDIGSSGDRRICEAPDLLLKGWSDEPITRSPRSSFLRVEGFWHEARK